MLSLLLRRTGVHNMRNNGLVITRLYRKDCRGSHPLLMMVPLPNSRLLSSWPALVTLKRKYNEKHGCKSENLNFRDETKEQYERLCYKNYPEAKNEQLRLNITDIHNVEKTRLPSERVRDISGKCINVFCCGNEEKEESGIPFDPDVRIENYSCSGLLDLSSSMQTSVPYPFQVKVKITHLNMPRGQWRQQAKYISEQLHTFHYRSFSTERKPVEGKATEDGREQQNEEPKKKLTLKDACRIYGPMAFVIYISVALASLGTIYLLISSGVDIEGIMKNWGMSEGAATAGAVGPFVAAYAIHKLLAPVRLSLTLIILSVFIKLRGKR